MFITAISCKNGVESVLGRFFEQSAVCCFRPSQIADGKHIMWWRK